MDWEEAMTQHAKSANADVVTMLSTGPPIWESPASLPVLANESHLTARDYLGGNNFNNSAILHAQQEYQAQVIAATFSSCSIVAATCAVYWFYMMRRNFRRDLILLLICGDWWKSMWFLISATTALTRGNIPTQSALCQATGYFLSVGIEVCDMAILLMSVHMQLQIFPPSNSFLGHDGLYRVRRIVLVVWFVLPNVMVSLAFVNRFSAFVSAGGFCTLPVRPYWYRLAISWIPRYLIWIYIFYVAIRIYRHVGFEFKVFGEERDRSSSFGVAGSISTKDSPTEVSAAMERSQSAKSDAATAEKCAGADQDIGPDDEEIGPSTPGRLFSLSIARAKRPDHGRRQSVPNWSTPFGVDEPEANPFAGSQLPQSKSSPSSRRGSRQVGHGVNTEDFASPPQLASGVHIGSVSTMGSGQSFSIPPHEQSSPGLDTIKEHKSADLRVAPVSSVDKALQKRRKAIQRQLRLLFIYPCVYLLMWVMPFVSHCLNYSNHFAQHPIFAITVLSLFCQSLMGTVDVIIFCWREKPWRHMPGSDGTFLGSFCFWRFAFVDQFAQQRRKSSAPLHRAADDEKNAEGSQNGLLGSLKRWSMSLSGKTTSPRPSQASLHGAGGGGGNGNAPEANDSSPPVVVRRTAPPMHRRTHSGGSDRRVLEAERAHARLALERAEYQQNRKSLTDCRSSVISASAPQEQHISSSSRKEWWDRHMSITDEFYDGKHVVRQQQ